MKRPMVSIARRVARICMRSDLLWELSQRTSLHQFFDRQRYPVIRKRARKQVAELLAPREVLAGPFTGMKYAEEASVGSSLWPKILGTYESEIHPWIERIVNKSQYDRIVDVGYAEGFYLIGLGRLFTKSKLVGFDSEAEARRLCLANASVNGIASDRLELFGEFESSTFRGVLRDKSLVVVDCEGFENDVVSCLSPDELARADWLIETHDHLVDGTTQRLVRAFALTHDLTEVSSDDDLVAKERLLPISVQRSCDRYVREALVSEGRMAKQGWLFAVRKAA